MFILDEFKSMLYIMLKPSAAAHQKFDITKSAEFYYKATAIPFILLLAATFFIHNQITQSIDLLFEILIWVMVPLLALFEALILHISGKSFFSSFKHSIQNTFHSVIISNSFLVYVLWLCIIYPPTALAVLGLAVVWSFVLLVILLSTNQGTTRTEAFIAVLVGYLLIYLLVNALAIILVGQIVPTVA